MDTAILTRAEMAEMPMMHQILPSLPLASPLRPLGYPRPARAGHLRNVMP